MNNRFTEEAQQAIQQAHEILQQKQHTQLDVEHIMLALLKQPDSTVARILQQMQVDVRALSTEVDAALSNIVRSYDAGYSGGLQIYITMRVKRMFEVAAEEADRLNNSYISTEHLFLAVVAERTGASARTLNQFGINKEKINVALQEVRELPSEPATTHWSSSHTSVRGDASDTQLVNAALRALFQHRIEAMEQEIFKLRSQVQSLEGKIDELLNLVRGEKPDA